MSALDPEALARLRSVADTEPELNNGESYVRRDDLRTLLDAYTEALDALLALRASYIADGGDRTDPGLQIAIRVLAKAGRG